MDEKGTDTQPPTNEESTHFLPGKADKEIPTTTQGLEEKRNHFWSEGRIILTSIYVLFVSDLLSALANNTLTFILGTDEEKSSKGAGFRILYIFAIVLTLLISKVIFKACLQRQSKKGDLEEDHSDEGPNKKKNYQQQLLVLISMYILFVTNFVSEVAKTTLDFVVPPSKCGVQNTFGRLAYFISFFIFLTGLFALGRFWIKRRSRDKDHVVPRITQEPKPKKRKHREPGNNVHGRKRSKSGKKTSKKKNGRKPEGNLKTPNKRANKERV